MNNKQPGLVIKVGIKACPECKGEVHKDANICPHCRTQLSEHPKWIEMKEQGGACAVALLAILSFPVLIGAVAYQFF